MKTHGSDVSLEWFTKISPLYLHHVTIVTVKTSVNRENSDLMLFFEPQQKIRCFVEAYLGFWLDNLHERMWIINRGYTFELLAVI